MILPERVFGRPGAHWIRSGEAIGPISLRTQVTSSLRSSSVGSIAGVERHIGVDALTLQVVRITDHRGLGHLRMRDQSAFDLGGAHAVTGHVDDVIDAAGDPVVAVLVAAAAVTREVVAFEGREVGLHEARMVANTVRDLAGPAIGDDRLPCVAPSSSCLHCRRRRLHAEERQRGRTGLGGGGAGQRDDQDAAGFGLPERINDRATAVTDDVWYHTQASGLIGSPTEPRRRSDRLVFFTKPSPSPISERMAVGAV